MLSLWARGSRPVASACSSTAATRWRGWRANRCVRPHMQTHAHILTLPNETPRAWPRAALCTPLTRYCALWLLLLLLLLRLLLLLQVKPMPFAAASALPAWLRLNGPLEALDARHDRETGGGASSDNTWWSATLVQAHQGVEPGEAGLRLWVRYEQSGYHQWVGAHEVREVPRPPLSIRRQRSPSPRVRSTPPPGPSPDLRASPCHGSFASSSAATRASSSSLGIHTIIRTKEDCTEILEHTAACTGIVLYCIKKTYR